MPTDKKPPSPNDLRRALSRQSYHGNFIRIEDDNLAGLDCLVATRRGLFGVHQSGYRAIAYGRFFGITEHGGHVYLFEACDITHKPSYMGRIVRMSRVGNHLCDPVVLTTGLDNGCHQIAVIDSHLHVVDTYRQAIHRLKLDGDFVESLLPLPVPAKGARQMPPYVHMNSITPIGDRIYLLLHNGTNQPPRKSEVAVFDKQWQMLDRYTIDGNGCHDIVPLEDGTILSCASDEGELIGSNGLKIKLGEELTRGLAFNAQTIMVGTSVLAEREERDNALGSVIFLDRQYRQFAKVELPGAPMCILSLS
jgi:hypothetical protein